MGEHDELSRSRYLLSPCWTNDFWDHASAGWLPSLQLHLRVKTVPLGLVRCKPKTEELIMLVLCSRRNAIQKMISCCCLIAQFWKHCS